MARRPTVSIVGCGRAGGAIGLALSRAGYPVTAAWSRTRAGRQRAQRLLEVPVFSEAAEVAAAGEVVVVGVPDDAISEVAGAISSADLSGKLVLHTSGGVSVQALAAAKSAGARTGCMHLLQTLPDAVRGAETLQGTAVAVTCDPRDRAALFRLARSWGGRPFPLADKDKTLYHAAAVFASNYVVTSIWSALRILERVGVPNARQMLAPLAQASVQNVTTMPAERAITGPVVRGDTETVKRHIDALGHTDPTGGRMTDAYRSLARLTAALARLDLTAFDKATA
ncbi:MAG TPA: Rossmann-like and DUF2520 domain-containing protein [Actinomycetota bacterium]|nr:Rossmann-like and DUF2520 domain-containing protein [Actinomycetota bacterium]